MKAEPVNEKYTVQKSTEEVLGNEYEGDFISIKTIDWRQQAIKPDCITHYNLPEVCRGIKSTYMICIRNTENFQSQPRTSIWIHEC